MRGSQSALWQDVRVGVVPPHYQLQVQHQLMVTGTEAAHLWVFNGSEGILHPIERDEASMEAIRTAWDEFQIYLDIDSPPPVTDGDTNMRDDVAWSDTATAFLAAKRDAEAADAKLDEVRAQLIVLCQHPREQGAGVTVTRYWKAGNVDYKRVPEIEGVDLNLYRGKGREEIRINICK